MTNEDKIARVLQDEPEYWGDLKELCNLLREELLLARSHIQHRDALIDRCREDRQNLWADSQRLLTENQRLRNLFATGGDRLEEMAESLRRGAEWMKAAKLADGG